MQHSQVLGYLYQYQNHRPAFGCTVFVVHYTPHGQIDNATFPNLVFLVQQTHGRFATLSFGFRLVA
jgi:hypothetical protein